MNINIASKKTKQQNQSTPSSIKISPVKVPVGAKQINNYILGKTIGTGTFSKVYLGLHIPTGQKVAVKVIQKNKLTNRDLQRIHREIEILKKIMHPSLIQLYQIIETQKSLLFITEYMQNGQLFNYIIQRKKLAQDQACRIFRQIIQGVEYMHKIGVTHRDLKPQNIMIDYDGKIKIIDFGLGNIYKKNQKLKTECGSPCYAAPEMIEGKQTRYDPLLIDIWSAGIVLFVMLAGYLPFCDADTAKLYKKILIGNYKTPSWVSNDAKDLLQKILMTNPNKRATLQQIKQHPWYKKQQSKSLIGVDTRYFKVPVEQLIINNIEKLGIKIPNLVHSVEQNIKNKQTALYYILAKKMIKQGYQLQRYFGCFAFKEDILQPLRTQDQIQNIQSSTYIEVAQVQPIKPNLDQLNTPQTNSASEFLYFRSQNILLDLQQIMSTKSQKQDGNKIEKKKQFYANSEQIKAKKYNLKQNLQKQYANKSENKQQKTIKTTIETYTIASRNIEKFMKAYKRMPTFTSLKKNSQLPEIKKNINKTTKFLQTVNLEQTTNPLKTNKKRYITDKDYSTFKNKHKRVPYLLL